MSEPPRPSGLALAALLLGLSTVCTSGATGLPAVVCGVLGIRDTRTRHVPGHAYAVAGVVFGGMAITGWAVVAVDVVVSR